MSWRYRVFRSDYEDEVSYSIHEVYTTDDGVRWTTDEMSPRGETLRGLADDLERMRRALYEPVLREVLNVQGEPDLLETDDEPRCMEGSQSVFTCPSCGHPCAQTVEPSVDIHSEAGYTCEECQASIIFEVMTERRYDAYCSLLPEIREAEEKAL